MQVDTGRTCLKLHDVFVLDTGVEQSLTRAGLELIDDLSIPARGHDTNAEVCAINLASTTRGQKGEGGEGADGHRCMQEARVSALSPVVQSSDDFKAS